MPNFIPYPQVTSTSAQKTSSNLQQQAQRAGMLVLNYLKNPDQELKDNIIDFYNDQIDYVSADLQNEITYYKYFNIHVRNFGVYANLLYTKTLVCYNYNLLNNFLGFNQTLQSMLIYDHGKKGSKCSYINNLIESFVNSAAYPRLLAVPLERLVTGCIKYGKCIGGIGSHQLTGQDVYNFIAGGQPGKVEGLDTLYNIFMKFIKSNIFSNAIQNYILISDSISNALQSSINELDFEIQDNFNFNDLDDIEEKDVDFPFGKIKVPGQEVTVKVSSEDDIQQLTDARTYNFNFNKKYMINPQGAGFPLVKETLSTNT